MRTLVLVRHAKACAKDLPIPDKDRHLKKRGKKDLKLMEAALLGHPVRPDYIFSSSANRAAQTATIIAGFYGMCDAITFHDELYHPDPEDIIDYARRLDDELQCAMIVGHNPELAEAAEMLWEGEFEENVPTSACVCLQFDTDSWSQIEAGTGGMLFYEYPRKYKQEA